MEKQLEIKAMISGNWGKYRQLMPEVGALHEPLTEEVYKDGVISGKNKRLMALVGGLVHGCRGCILSQTEYALQLGATSDELLEACAVAVSLGGTMAAAESARVVAYLSEKELL